MATRTVTRTLGQGGKLTSATVGQMGQAEATLPEGAQVEWTWTLASVPIVTTLALPFANLFGAPRVVALGDQVAQGLADIINALGQSGRPFAGMKRWPGQPLASANGSTLTIRWVKESIWTPTVFAVLGGGAALAADFFVGPSLVVALAIGAIVAVGIYAVMTGWKFIASWVEHLASPGSGVAGTSILEDVALGGAALLALVLIARGAHGR